MQYKPLSTHPWKRSYKAPKEEVESKEPRVVSSKPVRIFVLEVVENWGNIQITTSYSDTEKKFLEDLPPEKQVVWFTELLRKVYGIQAKHEYD